MLAFVSLWLCGCCSVPNLGVVVTLTGALAAGKLAVAEEDNEAGDGLAAGDRCAGDC